MKPVAVLAIILIVIGVIALAYGGFIIASRRGKRWRRSDR
jgi:formate-dependent nitrite reductase membrane component NrfD